MASFFGRFKSEGLSRFLAADDFEQLQDIVAERVNYYNRSRRHSSIEYQTPMSALRQMRLSCQGTNGAVGSVGNPGGVAHLAHGATTKVVTNHRQKLARRNPRS